MLAKKSISRGCERAHSAASAISLTFMTSNIRSGAISSDKAFDECIVLSKDAFDPDAVFLDDIVDDEVLPYPSLAVDGLTDRSDGQAGMLDLRPEDAANDDLAPDTTLPIATLDPEQLEVYGWESSLWRKIKGYLGF